MTGKNWEGQEGLSADCKLNSGITLVLLLSRDEHPCDRCNMDRAECRGFPPTPSHAEMLNPKQAGGS